MEFKDFSRLCGSWFISLNKFSLGSSPLWLTQYLSEQSDTLPQNCIWGLLSPHKERIILGHWRGYLNFTQVFYKVVIYLNRRLIPGTSEHFNRFFEMSSSPDATASKPKIQNTIVMAMHQERITLHFSFLTTLNLKVCKTSLGTKFWLILSI